VGSVLRLISLVVLARLLDPTDFGLVAMVTAITGVYGLFTDAGLSTATIQRQTITDEQISSLFWINMLVGSVLALFCLITAPLIVRFYNEPRLFWVTVISGAGFIINAAGVQHFALLERHLRFVALTIIQRFSQLAGLIVSITMAAWGFGYWALIAAGIVVPAMTTLCAWSITSWMPGRPRRGADVRSMLHFGGTVTLNGLVVYAAYNLEKVLLGRFWGADALGLYERSYQLLNVPTDNLNRAVGVVAFSALSRLQDDPVRFRSYFLKGYSLVNSITIPTIVFCALFADEIVPLALGPKWTDAVPIFRLLAPTVLVFGIINPLGWLLISSGLQVRSLRIALVIAPIVITAYVVGLPFGPTGVAFAYSTAMMVWLVPHVLWCLHGTAVSPRDLFLSISKPFLSAIVACAAAVGTHFYLGGWGGPLLSLALDATVMTAIYFTMLFVVMRQGDLYYTLLRDLRSPSGLDKDEV
jgi:PST family polysaccharide transporter